MLYIPDVARIIVESTLYNLLQLELNLVLQRPHVMDQISADVIQIRKYENRKLRNQQIWKNSATKLQISSQIVCEQEC